MTNPTRKPKQEHRQHGTGGISKLGPNRYLLRYEGATPGKKRDPRSEVFRGIKSEAKAHLATLIDLVRRGGIASNRALTFEQLAERFLAAETIERAGTTVDLYARTLRCHVLPVIGKIKVSKVTADHITALMMNAVDTSPRKKTRGRLLGATSRTSLRTLVSVLEHGVRNGVLVQNVCKQVPVPASAHREKVKFSRADVEAFVAASAGTWLGPIIIFAICTGLRRGEICGLKWSDFDMESGTYTLERAAKNYRGGVVLGKLKTKSARQEQWSAFGLRALREHRREQIERHLRSGIRPTDGFVFDDPQGEGLDPNDLSGAFHIFVVAKGLRRIRFHDLRHAYATNALASGTSLKVISESMGHSSIQITSNIYTDVLDEAKRERAERLDAYLGGAVAKGLRSGTGGD